MKIKVIVTDDHQLFRDGLTNMLFAAPDIEVVDKAENGKQAFEKAKHLKPDVMLLDINMPVLNGIETTKLLKAEMPEIKIIIISMHADKQYIKGVLEAGADGYLLKNSTYDQLVNAIRSVLDNKKVLSEDITAQVIDGYLEPSMSQAEGFDQLSEREKEVFTLFAEGKTTREIGDQLFISVKTVGTHKLNILEKLGLKNNADIIKYAIKEGIINVD